MTDANGNPRQVASADATQLMRPLNALNNPVQPQPLDLPKSSFGGYQPRAVEEMVAELQYKLGVAMRDREELNRVIASKQMENGKLNQRIADLSDENKRLKHAAENPMETLGKVAQDFINNAKGQADDIRAKVKAEAEEHMRASREKADALIRDAEKDAADTVAQAVSRKKEIDEQAAARIGESHEKAEAIIRKAQDAARELDAVSKSRAEEAGQREKRAANAVLEAKATLSRLLEDLK